MRFMLGCLALLVSASSLAAAGELAADLVLKNGKVWTVDPQQPEATAIAVFRERILQCAAP